MHTVKQSGPINKIAIVFKPLGINHFIKEDYIQVASAERQEFSPNNVALWKNVIQHCFDEDNPDKRIKLIEAFLLELHQPKDLTVLENVITKLSDVDNSATVEEIAVEANLSRRTLLRMFKKNLGMSPEMYRMIVRFRYAVNHKLKYHHKDNLTALAYESGFTDQSFMNRTFKKFTHCTPKQFFNLGIRLGSEDTFWRIH
ncbi:MAG TPA: helix-turn-helix domain-containing protein [Segetibacter sp.]|jgi:AraC-like DNA-binding protein